MRVKKIFFTAASFALVTPAAVHVLGQQRTGEIVVRIQRGLEKKDCVLFRIGHVGDDEDAFLFHDRDGEEKAVVEREVVGRQADLALVQARPAGRHRQRDFRRGPRRDGDLLFKTRPRVEHDLERLLHRRVAEVPDLDFERHRVAREHLRSD